MNGGFGKGTKPYLEVQGDWKGGLPPSSCTDGLIKG